jgi:twinkle protein
MELLPNGKKIGNEWAAGSTNGEEGQSLKVHLRGNKAGIWSDFSTGESGDLLDLYCATRGASLRESLEWARDWLGIEKEPLQRVAEKKTYRRPDRPRNAKVPASVVKTYLEKRGLTTETVKAFQVAEQDSHTFRHAKTETTCPAVVFPFKVGDELIAIKYLGTERPDGKKLIDAAGGCEPILFGWQAFPANQRKLIICEGEINAMSWHQYGFHALATPYGAGAKNKHAWLENEWVRLECFEEIYLNFDPDDAGKAAVKDLTERLGNYRTLVIPTMPDGHKDVNDCLIAGIGKEEIAALLFDAKPSDPEELHRASEYLDDILEEFYPTNADAVGLELPFDSVKDQFRLRFGELSIWTGFSGHGKTELLQFIQATVAARFQEKTCIASLEIKPSKTLTRLTKQVSGLALPTRERIAEINSWLAEYFFTYFTGKTVDWRKMLKTFEYAFKRYGIRFFIVDSLLKCGIRQDDYNEQKAFVEELCNLAMRLNVHIALVAHQRKTDSEEFVGSKMGVKGTGDITDLGMNVISAWRNKKKEEELEKHRNHEPSDFDMREILSMPDAIMKVQKQRDGDGELPSIRLWFDRNSKQFLDSPDTYAQPLIEDCTISDSWDVGSDIEF